MYAPDSWDFLGVGDPLHVARDERRGLLAVAGAPVPEKGTPVAVLTRRSFVRRALVHSRFPVHALAFHPRHELLAVGTGQYDGGYFFEGSLLLVHPRSGAVTSALADEFGRQVLGLEWLDERSLRVLMAPPDDWRDEAAHEHGHVAVVDRTDWRSVPGHSVSGRELAGPRVHAPRLERDEAARRAAAALRAIWETQRGAPQREG
ncbi:hypothetical protein [Streptomyces sp. NPDC049813]|uniref:hypothetical protein n=1 Tax=Streptomyces sp. NPDC049813 TaxID=3365597 RepID=UPI0037BA1285